ncbi:MAG: monovalent cation/H+ antiporter complex subunit F [Proteobacteria bacterium]|nr:monovalent cation/H+ antiporter complex subunit F [Pseudomonadota bacterium]
MLEGATGLALGLLAAAVLAAFTRLARGPSLADRVVALDAIAATIVAAAALYALRSGLAVFVDVALAVALVAFLGTVALAHAIESGGEP